MIPSKSLEDLIAAFETEITNAAETMPADRYRFNPACADEVTRVAQANYVVASNIVGGSPEVDLKMLGQLQTKKEILTGGIVRRCPRGSRENDRRTQECLDRRSWRRSEPIKDQPSSMGTVCG